MDEYPTVTLSSKDVQSLLVLLGDLAERVVSFECDCHAYRENDTGAWIHEEDKCAAYVEDHYEWWIELLTTGKRP